jgi:hypothetical protein
VGRHPQNGPSFSEAPQKNLPRKAAPSPGRQDAARAEAERMQQRKEASTRTRELGLWSNYAKRKGSKAASVDGLFRRWTAKIGTYQTRADLRQTCNKAVKT